MEMENVITGLHSITLSLVSDVNEELDFNTISKIIKDLPNRTMVHFSNKEGESSNHSKFGKIVKLLRNKECYLVLYTNGMNLADKADDIIDKIDRLVITVGKDECNEEYQYLITRSFLNVKNVRIPYTWIIYKEDYTNQFYHDYEEQALVIVESKDFNFKFYPEQMICGFILGNLIVQSNGDVVICDKYEALKDSLYLGNVKESSLHTMWYSDKKFLLTKLFLRGTKHLIPMCEKCTLWAGLN